MEELFAAMGGAGMMGFVAGFLFVGILLLIALYVYYSFTHMKMAQRMGHSSPAIAWIPLVGPLLIEAKLAQMHWWPILLLLLAWIPWLGLVAAAVLIIFRGIWMYKICEKRSYPGWMGAILGAEFIPIVGWLISIWELVLLGILAWGEK